MNSTIIPFPNGDFQVITVEEFKQLPQKRREEMLKLMLKPENKDRCYSLLKQILAVHWLPVSKSPASVSRGFLFLLIFCIVLN